MLTVDYRLLDLSVSEVYDLLLFWDQGGFVDGDRGCIVLNVGGDAGGREEV